LLAPASGILYVLFEINKKYEIYLKKWTLFYYSTQVKKNVRTASFIVKLARGVAWHIK